MTNPFEQAVIAKDRWQSDRGLLTIEDLFDLPLPVINQIAVGIDKEIKATSEESFLSTGSKANPSLIRKLEVLKRVIEIQEAKAAAQAEAKLKRQQRDKLEALIEQRQDQELANAPLEQLQEMLKNVL